MKEVIIENVIENADITVDDEDTVYTKDYMVDNYPKRPWKATDILGGAATITIDMPSGCDAIALFNIEATEVIFTMKDNLGNPIDGPTTYGIDALTSYYGMTVGILDNQIKRATLWIDYTYQSNVHTITLAIKNSTGSVAAVGIMRGGLNTNLPYNPRIGLKEGLIDYSLKKSNANGSAYYQKKDIIRTFSGSSLMGRNKMFYKVMAQIAQTKGEEPLAWKITDLGENQWNVFAGFKGMPSGGHDFTNYTNLSWNLVEAL